MTTPATIPGKRNLGGRPTKFTPALRERVLSCIERGMPVSLAASAAGITFQTLSTYRAAHPEFATAIQSAIARGVEKHLKKIEAAADAGEYRASCWILEHTLPEFFSKSRIQIEAVGSLEHSFVILSADLKRHRGSAGTS